MPTAVPCVEVPARPIGRLRRTDEMEQLQEMKDEVNDTLELTGDAKMWAVSGDAYFPCEKTDPILPPGQYIVSYNDSRGYFFQKKGINLDDLIALPDSESQHVLTSIKHFWTREKAFRKHGFLWKRGMLLWGPPGSGKTSTLQQLSKLIVEMGGFSVYVNGEPEFVAHGLAIMRKIEPNRPIIVMIEDIDAIISRHGEHALLALLDGELQIDNVVFIATTNYPENLDPRFVNRPSRFDEVIYIGMPNNDAREMFLSHKNPRLLEDKAELQKWVDATDNWSIAHMRELIVSVECLGNTFKATIERLKEMNDIKPSSEDSPDKVGMGFTSNALKKKSYR
jgi:SpoVK/Ycf46/Vps4 family AAA+-type ATPase